MTLLCAINFYDRHNSVWGYALGSDSRVGVVDCSVDSFGRINPKLGDVDEEFYLEKLNN